jgi:hypothetical protein
VRIRDFLTLVYDALASALPPQYADHTWRIRWSLLQLYYARAAVHYEVWVQTKHRRIEIGLHFEGEREESYGWAQALAPRAMEIQAQLGPEVELEEWTASWTRLHETRSFQGALNEHLAQDVGKRLAQFITVLEPIMAEEGTSVAR